MIKATLLAVLFCPAGIQPPLEDSRPRARLVRTFHTGDFIHAAEDAAIGLTAFANKPGDIIAVRVCSKEPLPVALAASSGRPFYLASFLSENYNFSRENIVFLRAADCSRHSRIAVTEFWAVPKGAALPPAAEALKASAVNAEEYWPRRGGTPQGDSFDELLTDVIRKAPPPGSTAIVVIGYYLRKPSPELRRNMARASTLLARSGIPANSYFLRTLPWTGIVDKDDREPAYPTIILLRYLKPAALPSATSHQE